MARRRKVKPEDEEDAPSFPPAKRAPVPDDAYLAVAQSLKTWKKASDVIDSVESRPTIFADFDEATRCAGVPLRRVVTVYGPSHGGKTVFGLGIARAFVERGDLAAYIDAEHATPEEFATELLGDLNAFPNFYASRPYCYEDTINGTDEFLEAVKKGRKVRKSLASVVVVDTINKLVPKGELKKVSKEAGSELAKGHQGRDRARLNQAWLDHLIPRLGDANTLFLVIAQERGAGVDPRGYPKDGDPKGGECLIYDSSMLIRCSKAAPLRASKEGPITGFKYRARIKKNKVGAMDGHHSDSYFYMSNGQGKIPAGIDRARDFLLVGERLGIVAKAGAWFSFRDEKWQGENAASAALSHDPLLLSDLVDEVHAKIKRRIAR